MSRPRTMPEHHKLRLQGHFGFTKVPFMKTIPASEMFDSRSQRELLHGLHLWSALGGLALVPAGPGVGKSITIRRFVTDLDDARFRVVHVTTVPSSAVGFLRVLNRALDLPMRSHAADLFDQAQRHLAQRADDSSPHPLLIVDDAEGLSADLLDILRRLTAHGLDGEQRFSILLSGTDDLLRTLRDPVLEPLRTRFSYVQPLRPFSLEDTRNYVAFHVARAGGSRSDLFTDDATRRMFQASAGRPRAINQLAIQALIQAAVESRDQIDGEFLAAQIAVHPLYDSASTRS